MPGIDYTLGMKTAGFNSGVQGALGKLASIGSAAAKITAGAGLAAGAGIAALIGKSIGKAADMETLRTAFVPLLGGMQEAKDRMADLTAFAANTPFELPEVAAASKTLETLTRGALSTGRGLTLVGDVASATNAPFSDLAVTIGRLYDGLQSGRPVGEVLMRLQELGAISGETRGKLEDLQKSGASGAEAWAVAEAALGRFTGSMKLQSGTWNGLLSTLRDTISAVMVKFGEPIMDALKPYLEGAISRIDALQAAAARAGQVIADAFSVLRVGFEQGRLFELAGASLKTGFLEALNVLAKGIQATMAGLGKGLNLRDMWSGVENLFDGIAKNFIATMLEGFSKIPGFQYSSLQNSSDQYRAEGADRLFQSRLEFGYALNNMSPQGFVDEFRKSFSGMADIPGLAEARENLTGITRGLSAAAAADTVFRQVLAEQDAASLVKGASNPAGAMAAATARTSGSPAAADRLAQIGGYVGNAAAGMAAKAQELTAKWTQQSAGYLKTIAGRSGARQPLTF